MKKIMSIAGIVLSIVVFCGSKPVDHPNANVVFNKVATRLAHLKTIRYHYWREFNYPSNDYLAKSDGEIYVDFSKENDLTGFKYYYNYKDGFSFFNNVELVMGNNLKKSLNVKRRLKPSDFEGNSALFNSMITLRNALPGIIRDESVLKAVSDTIINNRNYDVLKFSLHNKLINYLGTGFSKTTVDLTFDYKVIVDKFSNLPVTILQTKRGSLDLNRTDFTDINLNPTPLQDSVWYYSSYFPAYRVEQEPKHLQIISPGTVAPEWQLTNYRTDKATTLCEYKNSVILLEFWIKNCGYCINAVKELNLLHTNYTGKKFNVLAINNEDSRESIGKFISSHEVNYPVLFGDNSVEKAYGITAFPEVVLIDKSGKVVYSGPMDVDKLKPLIDKNL